MLQFEEFDDSIANEFGYISGDSFERTFDYLTYFSSAFLILYLIVIILVIILLIVLIRKLRK